MNDLRLLQQALHVAMEAIINRHDLTNSDWAELGILLEAAIKPINEQLGYLPEPDTDWENL